MAAAADLLADATPELSVVIPCTRPRAARACLEGLARQPEPARMEVLVIGDVAAIEVRDLPFDALRIPCAERHANTRRNQGLARARAPRIAFLDDDTVPEPGWLEAALALDPLADEIVTGPEIPLRNSPTARLLYAVTRNPWAEGTRAHVEFRAREVDWTEAPFCNLVLPSRAFAELGPPSVEVPWDMDDFEFCSRARQRYRFRNDPALRVRHDRYPDSVRPWLAAKWRQRVRIGNKLISHRAIYGRIPAIVLCALLPGLALLAAGLLPVPRAPWIGAGAAAYALFLTAQAPTAARALGLRRVPAYLGLVACLHALTVAGVQYGAIRELLQSRRARPRDPEGNGAGDQRGLIR